MMPFAFLFGPFSGFKLMPTVGPSLAMAPLILTLRWNQLKQLGKKSVRSERVIESKTAPGQFALNARRDPLHRSVFSLDASLCCLMTEPSATDTLPPLSVLCDAAREAGEIALRYFGNSPKVWTKPGNSPVTEADLAIDSMLHAELRRAFPTFGWLSEEIEDDGSRHSATPTFIVDPIDGTRGFMAGADDWVVSIALAHQGAPKLGVLFNPVIGDLMFAEAGKGAHLERSDGQVMPLTPSGKDKLEDALLAFPGASKTSHAFRKHPKIASLALRIARVAEGSLDGCVAIPNAKHWDIAAADLIVREAGIHLLHADGATPRYDTDTITHPALVCGTRALCDSLRQWISAQHS